VRLGSVPDDAGAVVQVDATVDTVVGAAVETVLLDADSGCSWSSLTTAATPIAISNTIVSIEANSLRTVRAARLTIPPKRQRRWTVIDPGATAKQLDYRST